MASDLRQLQSWLQMASARERAKLDAKVDALTQGLAHPLRRSILYYLVDEANHNKGTSPNELSKALDEPLTNISYHVRQLAQKGLIDLAGTAPRRGALEHYYKLTQLGRMAVQTGRFAEGVNA